MRDNSRRLRAILSRRERGRRYDVEQREPHTWCPSWPSAVARKQSGRFQLGMPIVAFASPGRDVDPMLFGFDETKQGERIRMTTYYNGHFVGSQVVPNRSEFEAQRTMWLRGDYDELVRRPVDSQQKPDILD